MSRDRDTTPRATYRVQLSAEFNFDQAAAIADYLAELGVSHLYCSPCFQAAKGSKHGYDVVDPRRVSDELGGEEGFRRLREALARRGLGLVLDIVPNHMAALPAENPFWRDVLQHGPAGRWAAFFDIDWNSPLPGLRGKVLLPILSQSYERVREAGAIRLESQGGRFILRCEGAELPVSPESLTRALGPSPLREDAEGLNADPRRLDELIEAQHYRLACWREADSRINYRRFFTIAGLVGVRVEDEEVFRQVHGLVMEWARAGLMDGLRVDHVDGLRDPAGYLGRLREACPDLWIVVEKILAPDEQLPEAWPGDGAGYLSRLRQACPNQWTVVEKILARKKKRPGTWPVDGTTGYDFLNQVGGLFVDPAGEAAMTTFYAEFTGQTADFAEIARRKKLDVLDLSFAAELDRLAGWLEEISRPEVVCAGITRGELREGLREMVASFPVYRTYLRPDRTASPADAAFIDAALKDARLHRPDLDRLIWVFIRDAIHFPRPGQQGFRWPGKPGVDFLARFQQLTGPVAAKGVEDSALYCFHRLVSLNEVGGDPARFGLSPEAFHRLCQERHRRRPRTMLATSTHDTKRGEDVRCRISLLAEIPQEWAAAVTRWSAMNAPLRRDEAPSRNDEYLFYQTLLGAWPIGVDRLTAYMTKAAREAGMRTTWADPRAEYEKALAQFVAGALADRGFIADLEAFLSPLLTPARTNSLAQTLIKCTAPGVPDFYQGAELWDLNLVDPDNRRAVDYLRRRALLAQLRGARAEDVWASPEEGLPKIFVIQRTLALRRRRQELLGPGAEYWPLTARGNKSRHVVAFARGEGAVTVVPRLPIRLGGDWADTCLPLPGGEWTDEFTGQTFRGEAPLATLLGRFPVALLIKGLRG